MPSKSKTAIVLRSIGLMTAWCIVEACQPAAPLQMQEPFSIGSLSYSIESIKLRSDPPYPGAMLRSPPPDRVYLVISYQVVNRGRTTVELGLPPFEVKTGDGQRFPANAMLSMLYPMEQAERSGSLQVMADAVNPELHPGLGGTYQVAFALTQDASRQHLFLIAKGPWLGFPETAVTLK